MKTLMLLLATCALAGCRHSPPAPAASNTPAPAASAAASAEPKQAGTYSFLLPDDTAGTLRLNQDGTFTGLRNDGKIVKSGHWSIDRNGRACFDAIGGVPKGASRCYVVTRPDPAGNFTATGENGKVIRVMKTA